MRLLSGLSFVGILLFAAGAAQADSINLDQLQWSVQYMIDQSQTVLGVNQFSYPRDNRGLALSPDQRYLYAGYNNSSSTYEVRKIDLTQPDYTNAIVSHLVGVNRGKAIAVDDVGRVYMADGSIVVYDADLTASQLTISGTKQEGVAVVRQSGQLVLYSSDRNSGNLSRYLLGESGSAVTSATLDSAWASGGQLALSSEIRGVEVDSSGRIWVADYDSDQVYVVAAGGSSYQTIGSVNSPMDIGFLGDTALVTRYSDRLISRFNVADLTSAGADLGAPLADLKLRDTDGALSGIAVVPGGGFYVAGEGINTANEHSTYGRDDGESGIDSGDGLYYTDLTHDDNDPILFAVPEPATLTLLLVGIAFAFFASAMRRKNR